MCRLRGINDEDVREIVEELRFHILDKAGASGEMTAAGVEAALVALGSPEELASEKYLTDNLLARAEVSRSPVQILESLFRWASLSVAGFFVLLGSILWGTSLGSCSFCVLCLKPFHPQTLQDYGFFRTAPATPVTSFRLGFGESHRWVVGMCWAGGSCRSGWLWAPELLMLTHQICALVRACIPQITCVTSSLNPRQREPQDSEVLMNIFANTKGKEIALPGRTCPPRNPGAEACYNWRQSKWLMIGELAIGVLICIAHAPTFQCVLGKNSVAAAAWIESLFGYAKSAGMASA